MYINLFWIGVISTIMVELGLLFLAIGIQYLKGGQNKKMKDKLLSCPFCGSKVHNRFAVKGMFTVICSGDDCGAMVSFLGTHKKSAAANKYNKRYTSEEPSLKISKEGDQ